MAAEHITGTTKVNGVATGGVQVRLHRADTGAVVKTVTSAAAPTSASDDWQPGFANEGANFVVEAGQKVRYGADVRWFEKTFPVAGTYNCGTGEFGGDPASGTSKSCQLSTPVPALAVGDYSIPNIIFTGEGYVVVKNPDADENDLIGRVYFGL